MAFDKKNRPPGALLRLLRKLKGLKQSGAAVKLDISQQEVSKLENTEKLSWKRFNAIITKLNITAEEIEIAKKFLPPPR